SQWGDVGRRFLEKMKFSENFDDWNAPKVPYIIVRHHDKDHDHIHIVAGRVRSDGTCVSDSWDYRRGEKAVRELEIEFGLSQPFKQTNRKSPHPYLVEKLERIYHNSDDSVISTEEEQLTPVCTTYDPIAEEVEKILEYRRQLKKAKGDTEDKGEGGDSEDKGDTGDKETKVEDDNRTCINKENTDYSLSSLIDRANKTSLSPNTTNSPNTSNYPQSSHSPHSPNTPLSQTSQISPTPPELPILINEVCQQVKTIPEFLKTLKDQGVEATIKLTRNKCVQGIIYHYQGERISGTKLGAAYTFPGLRKRQKLQFEKHHILDIEQHNRNCQPLPPPPKWQWLQDVAHRFNQWLIKNQRNHYQNDNFEVRREQNWLVISGKDLFVKTKYDQKKREWLPQSGWRFNQSDADLIAEKIPDSVIISPNNLRKSQKKR
ncbi:MAG: relaxase/mobilization nuclease domain-containing protein, partial [Crocosphaera sp.]